MAARVRAELAGMVVLSTAVASGHADLDPAWLAQALVEVMASQLRAVGGAADGRHHRHLRQPQQQGQRGPLERALEVALATLLQLEQAHGPAVLPWAAEAGGQQAPGCGMLAEVVEGVAALNPRLMELGGAVAEWALEHAGHLPRCALAGRCASCVSHSPRAR